MLIWQYFGEFLYSYILHRSTEGVFANLNKYFAGFYESVNKIKQYILYSTQKTVLYNNDQSYVQYVVNYTFLNVTNIYPGPSLYFWNIYILINLICWR
jgi:hypothetical protein